MKKPLILGADVGGSHVACGIVNLESLEPGFTSTVKLDSKAEKVKIFEDWARAINAVIISQGAEGTYINIGFSMPGPFDYKEGIALFEGSNDKYQHLAAANIPKELPPYLVRGNYTFRFVNDAAAFAVGAISHMKMNDNQKMIVLTLGTGLGASFLKDGVPVFNAGDVPENGCLWDKSFKEGIGDDYFSTRWFTGRFTALTGKEIAGVRELVTSDDELKRVIFHEFALNMTAFLTPYIKTFKPGALLIGGNIAKAGDYFLPDLKKSLAHSDVEIKVSNIGEEAAIIGSAQLFEPGFWEKIKHSA